MTERVEESQKQFFSLRSRKNARRRRALVPLLENEGFLDTCPNIETGRGFATIVIALGIDVSTNPPFAAMATKSGVLATENTVEAKPDRSLEEEI